MKPVQEDITIQIWDYVEGRCTATDAARIQQLIVADTNWQQEYKVIAALHTTLLKETEAEQPSMRFTKNIMDAIEGEKVTTAAKKYVNPLFVRGIAAFFIILLVVVVGYALSQVNWNEKSTSGLGSFTFKMPTLPVATMLNAFIMVNVILLLILIDRLLNRKRIREHQL